MTTPHRHAITLQQRAHVRRPPDEVFRFLVQEVPARYRELAVGHDRFDVEGGGPLVEGVVVDCRERAGPQEVHHRYVVRHLEPPRRLVYSSTPSHTFFAMGGRTIPGTCDTHVSYALAPATGGTALDMRIVIAFPSAWLLLLARIFGRTGRRWKRHQTEELGNLVRLIEQQPLSATA